MPTLPSSRPTRRPLRLRHKKLTNYVWDFDDLEEHEDLLAADDVYISLGTTIKKAGSTEAFRRVDYNYIVTAARIAHERGCNQCMLVSSVGGRRTKSLPLHPYQGKKPSAT